MLMHFRSRAELRRRHAHGDQQLSYRATASLSPARSVPEVLLRGLCSMSEGHFGVGEGSRRTMSTSYPCSMTSTGVAERSSVGCLETKIRALQ